jgi:hypothetical protein
MHQPINNISTKLNKTKVRPYSGLVSFSTEFLAQARMRHSRAGFAGRLEGRPRDPSSMKTGE